VQGPKNLVCGAYGGQEKRGSQAQMQKTKTGNADFVYCIIADGKQRDFLQAN